MTKRKIKDKSEFEHYSATTWQQRTTVEIVIKTSPDIGSVEIVAALNESVARIKNNLGVGD